MPSKDSLLWTILFLSWGHASPLPQSYPSSTSSNSLYKVHQFPSGSFLENIAVRQNGNILTSLTSSLEVRELSPFKPNVATTVHHFNGSTRVAGISEISPDVFAVATNPGIIWKMDFNSGSPAEVSLIANLSEAAFLNGVATVNSVSGTILISDSVLGGVWRVNAYTGESSLILRDDTMTPVDNASIPIGINGIRYHNKYLYYTNTAKELFCRVPINTISGHATGPAEIISSGVIADDFSIGPDGIGYLAGLTNNTLSKVFTNGTRVVIAGALDSADIATTTSAAFGRTELDADVLYITTGGGSLAPVNGTFTEGAKIMALKL